MKTADRDALLQAFLRDAGRRADDGSEREKARLERLFARHADHLQALRPVRQLTVTDYLDGEGAGSKALMVIYAMGFCRTFGLDYVHTPFSGLTHADRPQAAFDTAWEAFFNLGEGETPAAQVAQEEVFDLFLLSHLQLAEGGDLTRLLDPPLPGPRPAYYLEIESIEHAPLRMLYAQQFLDVLRPVLPDVRQRFRAGKPAATSEVFELAVHIRRGDVGPDRSDMWTDLDAVKRTLTGAVEVLAGQGIQPRITVYSEGDPADFTGLGGFGAELVLGGDPMATMERLIRADMLVMAKSCFSYVAALLSDGIKLAEQSRWPSFEDWIERGPDGLFDQAALASRLGGSTAPRP